MNRGAVRAFVLALVLLAAGFAPVLAPARVDAGTAEPQFSLLAQEPAWVNLGGDVLLRLDVPAALLPPNETVNLRLRIHQALTSTTAFDSTIEGDRLGNRIDRTYEFPVRSLYRDAQGAVLVAFGLFGSTREPAFNIRSPGVYPLEVALRTDETIASFVTWIVVADPAATIPPVHLASVWNVTSAPVRDAEGTADPAVVSELAPGGRLGQIATLLDDAAPMPLTLQVGPETLESWNALAQTNPRLAAGVTSVKEAAARTNVQLLPAPYVPIDLTSLEAAGLGSQLPNQLRTGAQVLEQLTNVSPSSRTAFVDPVDAAALASVRDLLVDRVAVRGPSIANVSATDTLNPFVLAAGDGTLRAGGHDAEVRRDPRERRLSRAARATAPRRAVDTCVRARGADGCGARGPGELGARCRDRARPHHRGRRPPVRAARHPRQPVRERAAGHERRRAGHARARAP